MDGESDCYNIKTCIEVLRLMSVTKNWNGKNLNMFVLTLLFARYINKHWIICFNNVSIFVKGIVEDLIFLE